MGGMFSKPKMPATPPPEPMPVPDDDSDIGRKRQEAARRVMASGRQATIQTSGPQNKPIGS